MTPRFLDSIRKPRHVFCENMATEADIADSMLCCIAKGVILGTLNRNGLFHLPFLTLASTCSTTKYVM